MVLLSAPSNPVVELELTLITAEIVAAVVAKPIVRFLEPAVARSSPSIVTLSAPANSTMARLAVAVPLIVQLPPLGFIAIEV